VTVAGGTQPRFRLLPPDRAADEMEQEMLARWADEDLFAQTLRATEGGPEFVFFEGPPTANGRPGIHHVFARTLKDLFCRHRAMKGFHVARKGGWDTHGLPVEIEVEKQLGISGKQQIDEIGVERFNQLCRESVWKYQAEWKSLSERIGYWLDYENAYVTYSNNYVESVWWALKTLFDKGLLARGHKILPYCPRRGTTLSSHEVAQGYEDVEDPSVYLALTLTGEAWGAPPETESGAPSVPSRNQIVPDRRILVWTTTPWTLVSNAALAVHPDLDYVELRKRDGKDPRTVILAAPRMDAVLGDDAASRWETVATFKGANLEGLRYRRPLDWVAYDEGEHEIIIAEDFVSADDGTGVVHMSPAFGADDYAAGKRRGLAFLQPVNARGEFPAGLPLVGGTFVKDADPLIIEELKRRDVLWKAGKLTHAYPHCWRCATPLLYYARGSWFIRTTEYRNDMLARNARVAWHPPEVGEGRFGEWLKNNIDWAISRDRYWGTPLPLWVCDADTDHVVAIGSFGELAARVGPLGDTFDPHKPFIDAHSFPCEHAGDGTRPAARSPQSAARSPQSAARTRTSPACSGTMRRVPEVIDTWFDSGSMPFAQWHYPFENRDVLERSYPADFIAEGVDQTRGWFYSLLAIAAGLGDALPNNVMPGTRATSSGAAPYRTVVVNDMVLDAHGQKMSKSRGNIAEPWTVVSRHGADAVRLFLISSSQVWVPRRFDEDAIRETVGRFLLTFKNVYSGIFAQMANFGWSPSEVDPAPEARPAIDRWVLSRLNSVERTVDKLLDEYDATLAAREVMQFVVDDVSNWYVRQSRARFYDVEGDDNRAAFATLHEVLVSTCRLLAPFTPFVSDWMHRELTGTSVHLAEFGRRARHLIDVDTERAMSQIRELARLGRAAREDAGIKVRQPLDRMVCVVPNGDRVALEKLFPLLASELNVKRVELASNADTLVSLQAKANFRTLGKKFGKLTPRAAEAASALSGETLRGFERGEEVHLEVDGVSRKLDRDDLIIIRGASGSLAVKEEAGFFAAIDPAISPALRREGLARELVSRVQRMRKEAGLLVSDRIVLAVTGSDEVRAALREMREWVAGEVLASEIVESELGQSTAVQDLELDGLSVRIALNRIQ